MLRITLFCLVYFCSQIAVADGPLSESGLQTPVFALTFPSGWKLEKKTVPIPLRGPQGQLMLVSPIMPDPNAETKTVDPNSLQEFWRSKIRESLTSAVSQEGMNITEELNETRLHGMPYFATSSRRQTDSSFLAGYGLIGQKGVVFIVTVEGWTKDEAAAREAAEAMLKTVDWRQ